MTSIILISNGARPRLLEQTLRTLQVNTPADQFNLTIVVDGDRYRFAATVIERCSIVTVQPACNIIGRLKNLGAWWSERQFGRSEWLCFLDDDMALFPGWLERMTQTYQGTISRGLRLCLLGSVRHPFHGLSTLQWTDPDWDETDAVAGYCHFMKWTMWDHFGPYDGHAKGTGQSEDYGFSRKIVDAGGKVGYIHPPVMAHTGLTSSEGNPILGGELIERVPGVLFE